MRNRRKLKNEINVVPYIDVMLVLLVIFMVTAPMMPTGTVSLPTVGVAATPPTAPIEISVKPDPSNVANLIACAEKAGPVTLTMIDRSNPSNKENTVTLDQLVQQLQEIQRKNPEQAVVIAGDKTLPYEQVMRVMDQLQKSQVGRVGLLVSPTGK